MTEAFISAMLLLASPPRLTAVVDRSCATPSQAAATVRVHCRLVVYSGGYLNLRL